MKAQYRLIVSFIVIIIASFLSGCVIGPEVRSGPVVVGFPVAPGQPGFGNQQARNIRAPQRFPGSLSVIGVPSATVEVINNSQYLVCIAQGPVWIYPHAESFTVSLDRVAQSFNSSTTSLTIQVFDAVTKNPIVTLVSRDYYMPQMSAYSQTQEYKMVITDQLVKNWLAGNQYW